MKILSKIATLLILLFWQLVLNAQIDAGVTLDTNSIMVGDQTNLVLSFSCPANFSVAWPNLTDTIISEIEIIEKSKIDTAYSENESLAYLRQTLKITSFDSGFYAIPPFRFNYRQPGDSVIHFKETDALLLEVTTIPVNTEQAIKDIKNPLKAPYTFREILPWIIIVLIVLVVGYFVYYFLQKRKNAEPIFKAPPKPKQPPHQIALDALENLRLKKLWQSNRIKEYHTELTDIIRIYISKRFNIHALEFTTDEIMEAIGNTATNEHAKEKLRQILMLADLVKFAKEQPLPMEHDASLNNAIDFIKETIHKDVQ